MRARVVRAEDLASAPPTSAVAPSAAAMKPLAHALVLVLLAAAAARAQMPVPLQAVQRVPVTDSGTDSAAAAAALDLHGSPSTAVRPLGARPRPPAG